MKLVVETTGAPQASEDLLQRLCKQWDANLYGVGFPSAQFYGKRGAAERTYTNVKDAVAVALWGFGVSPENIDLIFAPGEMNEDFQYTNCTATLRWQPSPSKVSL